jgi:hypothetical protein
MSHTGKYNYCERIGRLGVRPHVSVVDIEPRDVCGIRAEWVPVSGTSAALMRQGIGASGTTTGSKTTTGVSAVREAA